MVEDVVVADVGALADVDIGAFAGGEAVASEADREAAMQSWDAAFRKVGFARIIGHGVPSELVAELRTAAIDFFDKPSAEKMIYHRQPNRGVCGAGSYTPVWAGRVMGSHDDPLEGYTFHRPSGGWEHVTDLGLGHPPGLAAVAKRYGHALENVMHALHRLSAGALGLPADFFDSPPGSAPSSLLVISHYPPLTEPEIGVREPGKPRYRAHSDYTGFTILLQDERDHGAGAGKEDGGGGLEVDVDGTWLPVVPRPGAFVVNIGDLFELWTNNRWRSTPHRVSSPMEGSAAASRGRLTAMLFTGPALEKVVQPAPTCGPSAYRTMTAREHLAAMATTKSKEAQYKRPSSTPVAAARPSAAEEQAALALIVTCGAGHSECARLLIKAACIAAPSMELAAQNAEKHGHAECAQLVRDELARREALQDTAAAAAGPPMSAHGAQAAVPLSPPPPPTEEDRQRQSDL